MSAKSRIWITNWPNVMFGNMVLLFYFRPFIANGYGFDVFSRKGAKGQRRKVFLSDLFTLRLCVK